MTELILLRSQISVEATIKEVAAVTADGEASMYGRLPSFWVTHNGWRTFPVRVATRPRERVMTGYFWPHVFATDGADQRVCLEPSEPDLLNRRLNTIVSVLRSAGVKNTDRLLKAPVSFAPILEVAADALIDTGLAATSSVAECSPKDGGLHLMISATKDDLGLLDEARGWIMRASMKQTRQVGK